MANNFIGKTVLVTGASRGIGAATAKHFAKLGATVCLTARTKSALHEVQVEIEKSGGKAFVHAADLAQPGEIRALFTFVDEKFGTLDVLVNNAGLGVLKPIPEITVEDWDKTFAINVRAMFLCAQAAMKRMRPGGVILNISSLAGIRGVEKFPGLAPYTASKHAVIGLTEALAVEAKALGIRVNAVAPGAVDTEMLRAAAPQLKTSTKPEDIAKTLAFLANDDEAKRITGSILEIHSNE